VGILTNVSEDHLGLGDINTLDDMVLVKSVVPRSVHKNGYAVLNADEEYLEKLLPEIESKIALFSLHDDNSHILRQKEKGGLAAYVSENRFVFFDGKQEIRVAAVDEVPITHMGKAHFMIENVLPAIITGYVQGFSFEHIRQALQSFHNTAEANPGRMNFFDFQDFRIMLDYAHNPAGLAAVGKFIALQEATWNIGIIAAPGDRRDEDIIKIGRTAASIFDHIIIRHDKDMRGRTEENVQNLLIQGIKDASPDKTVDVRSDEAEALALALQKVKKNSLISVFSESPEETIKTINTLVREHNTDKTLQPLKNKALGNKGL
jgi:cyanophycin synthetase